jgi:hypothetical protein
VVRLLVIDFDRIFDGGKLNQRNCFLVWSNESVLWIGAENLAGHGQMNLESDAFGSSVFQDNCAVDNVVDAEKIFEWIGNAS